MRCRSILIPIFLTLAANVAVAGKMSDEEELIILQTIEEAEQEEYEEWNKENKENHIIDNFIKNDLQKYANKYNPVSMPAWIKPEEYDLPVEYNAKVESIINYFSGSGRGFFAKWLDRSVHIRPIVEPILEKYEVPKDLFFLSMIESGLSMKAYSAAKAAGPWQFMKATGMNYQLRVDSNVDQRMDLILSTQAAARYLKRLYKQFGDWHLAMAAYNAGEGRVAGAIKRCGSNNYWELISTDKCLAEETRNYVPKVLAAAIIYKNAEHYGFKKPVPIKVAPVKEVNVPRKLTFSQISALSGVPLQAIAQYNYSLLGHQTPASGSYHFYVAETYYKQMTAAYNKLLAASKKAPAAPKQQVATNNSKIYHTVKKGDTLSGIAKKYNVKPDQIVKANKLKNNNVMLGTKLLIPTQNVSAAPAVPAKTEPKNSPKAVAVSMTAKQKAVTNQKNTANKNTVTNNSNKNTTAKKNTAAQKTATKKTVKVQPGDTLWKIARQNGLTVDQLVAMNKFLADGKVLQAGMILTVAK